MQKGIITVCRGWDQYEGSIAHKSGRERTVPIASELRAYLAEYLLALGWNDGLVFGAEFEFTDLGNEGFAFGWYIFGRLL